MTHATNTVPPGPRGLEMLGFLGLGSFETTLGFLCAQARKHGAITAFRFSARRLYLIDDADLLRSVLVSNQHRFSRAAGTQLLREITGVNLATTDEPLHRERRRLLQPAFASHAIAAYGRVMVEEAAHASTEWHDGQVLDAGAAMTSTTLRVASRTLFGAVDPDAYVMSQALARAMRSISRIGPFLEVAPAWGHALRVFRSAMLRPARPVRLRIAARVRVDRQPKADPSARSAVPLPAL